MNGASPFLIFGFLGRRTIQNAVVRRVRRLKEPRYLIGLVFGLFYFVTMFLRPGRQGRMGKQLAGLPQELPEILLLAAAFAFAVIVLFSWLLRSGDQALKLSEAEVQFLFPAPLSPRAVLHYALLRTQLGLLVSSLIVTLVFRRNLTGTGLRMTLGIWVLLSVMQFHLQALGFTKARWRERPARTRSASFIATFAVVIAAGAVLSIGLYQGIGTAISALIDGRMPTLAGIEPAIASTRAGALSLALIWPIRLVLLPLIARDTPHFLTALGPALGIFLLHYAWLARTAVRYEEATLEHAGRRAEQRLRRQEGNLGRKAHSKGGRDKVPFSLDGSGRPELAIVWKNLLAFGRFRGRRVAIGIAAVLVLSLAGSAVAVGLRPSLGSVALTLAGLVTCMALMIGLMITFTVRNDLRGDLEQASLLRLWPIPSTNLVAAELAAPWLLSTAIVWGGLAIALALATGSFLALGQHGMAQETVHVSRIARLTPLRMLLPIALGIAIAFPALVALALVVQNGTVLAFPAWFPPGRTRSPGLESTGTRLLSMMAILLLLIVALIPAAILVVPLCFFGWSTLGVWCVPIAGVLTAVPLAVEAAAGVLVLARLFERFDPSLELNG